MINKIRLTQNAIKIRRGKLMDIKNIINFLRSSSNEENGFLGFTEWTDNEFCIKANNDGLKLFAATVLEGTEMTK